MPNPPQPPDVETLTPDEIEHAKDVLSWTGENSLDHRVFSFALSAQARIAELEQIQSDCREWLRPFADRDIVLRLDSLVRRALDCNKFREEQITFRDAQIAELQGAVDGLVDEMTELLRAYKDAWHELRRTSHANHALRIVDWGVFKDREETAEALLASPAATGSKVQLVTCGECKGLHSKDKCHDDSYGNYMCFECVESNRIMLDQQAELSKLRLAVERKSEMYDFLIGNIRNFFTTFTNMTRIDFEKRVSETESGVDYRIGQMKARNAIAPPRGDEGK